MIRDIRMYIPPHSSPGGVPFPRVRTGTAAAVYSYIRKADCYYFVSAMETLIVVARQTPVPLICIVCWVLACTAPGTRYAFLFFLFSSSGGWVKIKLKLPHFHVPGMYVSDTCRVSIQPTLPLQQQLALLEPGS